MKLEYSWDGHRMHLTGYDRCRLAPGATLSDAAQVFRQGTSDHRLVQRYARALLSSAQSGRWWELDATLRQGSLSSERVEQLVAQEQDFASTHLGSLARSRLDLERMTLDGPSGSVTFALGKNLRILASASGATFEGPPIRWEDVPNEPGARLLRPGSCHSDEVDARTGEEWLALVVDRGGSELRWARLCVDVDRASTSLYDTRISADGPDGSVLVLVDGVGGLSAGPVTTVFPPRLVLNSDVYCGTRRDSPLSLRLGGVNYGLRLDAPRTRPGHHILEYGDRQQILADADDYLRRGQFSYPDLIWAGDLDRDGSLDAILDAGGYNCTEWTLFLSSRARSWELLRKVVSWRNLGC